jgi:signal transduction histidine kinase
VAGTRQAPAPAARRAAAGAVCAVSLLLWAAGVVLAIADTGAAEILPGTAALAFGLVGALVVLQRPANQLGPILCAIGLAMGAAQTGGQYAGWALSGHHSGLPYASFVAWLSDSLALPIVGLFVGVLPQLFPDGRPIGRPWRYPVWAAYVFIGCATIGNAFAAQDLESVRGMPNPYALPTPLQAVLGVLIVVSIPFGLAALAGSGTSLVVRWRRSLGDERQQLKWFAAGIAPIPVPLLLHGPFPVFAGALFSLLIPVTAAAMGVAILRYRLYDLDLVVRRAVLYATVSVLAGALYLGVVALADALVAGGSSTLVDLAAAVAVAGAFHPLLVRCRGWVDRLFYGDRSSPHDAVAKLGVSVERALLPQEVLPEVVRTVAEALRLPYVAIELAEPSQDIAAIAAAHGQPTGAPVESFPMTYQGAPVGRLLASCRRTESELHTADRRVLTELARHTGVAAEAVRTSLALQRSRMALVAAREEERRRLRRDLHDGLGPTLAGVTLGLHAAQVQLVTNPEAARRLLADLESQVETAIADIRQLVYQLRPPALDEFGLVGAVAMQATHLEDRDFTVQVRPEQPLGRLPAAVEVAAYRIATEAMTNVSRHAQARRCTVTLTLNGQLNVEIADDGKGIAPNAPLGVGLTAMRERTDELGGTLTITSGPTGTVIMAQLPLDPTTSDSTPRAEVLP